MIGANIGTKSGWLKYKSTPDRSRKLLSEKLLAIEQNTYREKLRMAVLYKQSLKTIQSKIAELYADYGDKIESGQFYNYNRLKTLENQILREIKRLNGEMIDKTKNTVAGAYEQGYLRTGQIYEQTIGSSLGFGLLNPKQIEAAVFRVPYEIRWDKRMTHNHEVYARQVKESVVKGIQQGKGYSQIAKDVKDRAEIGKNKTLRIVKTETHRAVEQGTIQAYDKVTESAQELGLATRKKWMATLDSRTRDSHVFMDGQMADEAGMFYVNGIPTEAPGMTGDAGEDINCRCTTILEIIGL